MRAQLTLGISAAAGAEVARGVVTGLEADGGGRWEVTLEAGDAIAADGVVLTKARPVITVPGQPREHPRVLDGRANWLSYGENRFYSDPARWPCLAEAHRSESLTLLGQQANGRYRDALGGGELERVTGTNLPVAGWRRRCTCRSWQGSPQGPGFSEPQLPRPAERPHPPPLCCGQRHRSAGTGKRERA